MSCTLITSSSEPQTPWQRKAGTDRESLWLLGNITPTSHNRMIPFKAARRRGAQLLNPDSVCPQTRYTLQETTPPQETSSQAGSGALPGRSPSICTFPRNPVSTCKNNLCLCSYCKLSENNLSFSLLYSCKYLAQF